jgi:hypothetical protein
MTKRKYERAAPGMGAKAIKRRETGHDAATVERVVEKMMSPRGLGTFSEKDHSEGRPKPSLPRVRFLEHVCRTDAKPCYDRLGCFE